MTNVLCPAATRKHFPFYLLFLGIEIWSDLIRQNGNDTFS